MKLVSLSDKLSLSAVVQGFWRLEDWKWTTEELVKFMNACIERGVTSFDTAEIYSATLCEKMMGEAFAADKSIRGKIQLISKTGIFQEQINGKTFGYYNTTYNRIMQSCKESLQRLQTDYLDARVIIGPS
jgi:predicted oxidoreductase